MGGYSGRDELVVLVSTEPFSLFPMDYENEVFFQLNNKNPDKLAKTSKNLMAAKSMDFAQTRFTYTIDE